MELVFTIAVILILVFCIFWYGLHASSRLISDSLEKDITEFFEDVSGKDDYTLYVPDDQSVWRHGDRDTFFSRRREWISPSTAMKTRVAFS